MCALSLAVRALAARWPPTATTQPPSQHIRKSLSLRCLELNPLLWAPKQSTTTSTARRRRGDTHRCDATSHPRAAVAIDGSSRRPPYMHERSREQEREPLRAAASRRRRRACRRAAAPLRVFGKWVRRAGLRRPAAAASSDDPRGSRGVAATRPWTIHVAATRRTIHAVAAASPRRVLGRCNDPSRTTHPRLIKLSHALHF